MTTKPVAPAQSVSQFPEMPSRDDMENPLFLYEPGHPTALRLHFGISPTIVIIGETPVAWHPGQGAGTLIPDLLIAFNVDREQVIAQRGYAINERGKPPDFVLEIASPSTGRNDENRKREGYAAYRVPEYWRFDSSGGRYHRAQLAGDRLADGTYQPITINKVNDDMYWGHSEILNLALCWEYGQLRWYDPVARRYLLTHEELAEAQQAAEAERDAEAAARLAAETKARQLQAELRRLQNR